MENLNTSVENTSSDSGSLPALSRFARTLVIQQLRLLGEGKLTVRRNPGLKTLYSETAIASTSRQS